MPKADPAAGLTGAGNHDGDDRIEDRGVQIVHARFPSAWFEPRLAVASPKHVSPLAGMIVLDLPVFTVRTEPGADGPATLLNK
jgi:hypothetical protein